MQCIQARCASILPSKGMMWSKEAAEFFTSVTLEKSFIARLRGIRKSVSVRKNFSIHFVCFLKLHEKSLFQNTRLSLDLIDTVSNDLPEGININKLMVEKGFAIKDIDGDIVDDFKQNIETLVEYDAKKQQSLSSLRLPERPFLLLKSKEKPNENGPQANSINTSSNIGGKKIS